MLFKGIVIDSFGNDDIAAATFYSNSLTGGGVFFTIAKAGAGAAVCSSAFDAASFAAAFAFIFAIKLEEFAFSGFGA